MLRKYGSWTEESANMWRCPLPRNLECMDYLKLLGKNKKYHHICKEKCYVLEMQEIISIAAKSAPETRRASVSLDTCKAMSAVPRQWLFCPCKGCSKSISGLATTSLSLKSGVARRFFFWPYFSSAHPMCHSTSLSSSVCKATVLAHTALPLHLSFLALLKFCLELTLLLSTSVNVCHFR